VGEKVWEMLLNQKGVKRIYAMEDPRLGAKKQKESENERFPLCWERITVLVRVRRGGGEG